MRRLAPLMLLAALACASPGGYYPAEVINMTRSFNTSGQPTYFLELAWTDENEIYQQRLVEVGGGEFSLAAHGQVCVRGLVDGSIRITSCK